MSCGAAKEKITIVQEIFSFPWLYILADGGATVTSDRMREMG